MKENKEQTKKNPWRFAFLACAVYGAVKLLGGLWVNIVYWLSVFFMEIRSEFVPNEAYSIGIIGGADGPTAIFVTAPVWVSCLIPTAAMIVGIWGYLHLSRPSQK